MEKTITITDVTRMRAPRVCVAGVTDDGQCIRPIFEREGILESWLYHQDGIPVVRPFAKITLDVWEERPQPPHSEDWIVSPEIKGFSPVPLPRDNRMLLERILDPSVAGIFQAEIHQDFGFYIKEGEGKRSLGTIRPAKIFQVKHACYDGKWDYRIYFEDRGRCTYRLKVVDLSFLYYVDHLREQTGMSCESISTMLTEKLQRAGTYLRLGLTRPTWDKHPHCCALQITGVYSFPDYLDGRCFADFVHHQQPHNQAN